MNTKIATLVLIWVVTSCAISENKTYRQRISYSSETFTHTSKGCGSDTVACATYEVVYPVFSGIDSAVASSIETKINVFTALGNPDAKGWTRKQIANDFIDGFEKLQERSAELAEGRWYYKAQVHVETLSDTLISLSVNDEYFTGGAHGGAGTYFITINPKTGQEIKLEDVLKPGFITYFTHEGERSFREVRGLADTTSLMNSGFEFADNKFQLNSNYGFRPEGIVFVYNSYEIAPYAMGPTQIVIPYDRIKDWLQ
jgi:hypothetical protein